MKHLARDGDSPEIPLTSLIDVVFLLLVFFLVATTFARREFDHAVRLPQSEGGAPSRAEPRHLVINVRSDGSVTVEGSLLDRDALRRRLEEWRRSQPDGRVSLRGDAKADYQAVMRVFGLCRAVGIPDIDMPVEDYAFDGGPT